MAQLSPSNSAAAAYNDLPEVVELLLEAGADLNATNVYGSTALNAAGAGNSVAAAAVLLEAGIVVTARDLSDAILSGSSDFLRLIVEDGHINRISDAVRSDMADRARRIGSGDNVAIMAEITAMLDPNGSDDDN